MKFRIDFNYLFNSDDEVLVELGAKPEYIDFGKGEELAGYFMDIDSLGDLEKMQDKLRKLTNIDYSLVVDFDEGNNTIFFDENV